MKKLLLFTVLVFLLQTTPALAWSRNGHMIIGAMTYRMLPAEMQMAYTDLLMAHPEFDSWEREYAALNVTLPLGEYLFMMASIWPDEIRRAGGPYNHPTWHYTNFPLIPDGYPMEETLTPENDVIFAIQESRRILADSSASQVDRAAHLSWILHVIGDLHQPLHTVALVNDLYPEGDRGGNLFFVRPRESSKGVNLHAYWDGLLGTNGEVREARNDATLFLHQFEKKARLETPADFEVRDWALEGREIAIDAVYMRGEIAPATEEQREASSVLPEAYGQRAKSIAQERVVIASLRLLDVLTDL